VVDGNPLGERDTATAGYHPRRPVVTDAVGAMVPAPLDALVADQVG
jgi:hypothetical protein